MIKRYFDENSIDVPNYVTWTYVQEMGGDLSKYSLDSAIEFVTNCHALCFMDNDRNTVDPVKLLQDAWKHISKVNTSDVPFVEHSVFQSDEMMRCDALMYM